MASRSNLHSFLLLNDAMNLIPLKWESEIDVLKDEERQAYVEAFEAFDWSKNGKIACGSLLHAMRRVGLNPSEVEVLDTINRTDDGSGTLTFGDFCKIIHKKKKEEDPENDYKETFRAFSKDDDGCVPADELKFVLQNLPGKVS